MVKTSLLSISPAPPFDFFHTVCSHGWVSLHPNAWDEARQTLKRVERLSNGQVVLLDVFSKGKPKEPKVAIKVAYGDTLTKEGKAEIRAVVRRMLRLDEDLSEFYALCRARGKPWVMLASGMGRLLRSPTVFEDVVKTICTTNIQWSGTKRLVENLVNSLGEPFPGDASLRAFPTAEAMAAEPLKTFTEIVRLGYRGEYVSTLARQVALGELELENLRDGSIPTGELRRRLLSIKGVGNYAAATMLMLLGRYEELGVDTVLRDFVGQQYFGGRRPSDEEAKGIYEAWGEWKYLAYWFDLLQSIEEKS